MIEWGSLAANTLWILGCALWVATWSYTSWEASRSHEKMSIRLRQPARQAILWLSAALFCLGLAFTSNAAWRLAAWLLLAAACVLKSVTDLRKQGKHLPSQHDLQ